MNHKNSNRLAVLLVVAGIFFFAGRGISARTQLSATNIPPAQQAGQSIGPLTPTLSAVIGPILSPQEVHRSSKGRTNFR